MNNASQGAKFKQAMKQEQPLQLIGTVNAYVAMMAKSVGYRAIYLSGAGVSNSSYGVPDIGVTSLDNVLEDVIRITDAVDLPLIVDIDTGWGGQAVIAKAIRLMIKGGAAGIHIEDQINQKRCGHLPGKEVVPPLEMVDRLKAALDARTDPDFMIIARTDALATEGFESALERAIMYRDVGADAIFPEAILTLDQYKTFKSTIGLPILANVTEFGKTPLFSISELKDAGVDIALYPLSVNRVMNFAAKEALEEIRGKGSQRGLLEKMQPRQQLYEYLNYKI
jgi:methylisocitrate lyase